VPRNIFRKCEACIEGGWQRFPVVVSVNFRCTRLSYLWPSIISPCAFNR